MKARCSFWLIHWVHTSTSLHKEYKHEHFTTKDNTNLFYKQVLTNEILLIGVHKLLKFWNNSGSLILSAQVMSSLPPPPLGCSGKLLSSIQGKSESVVTSAAIWFLEAPFSAVRGGREKKERKKEIWAWWNQMAHKVRAVRHTAF